jgi:hypothetical protein
MSGVFERSRSVRRRKVGRDDSVSMGRGCRDTAGGVVMIESRPFIRGEHGAPEGNAPSAEAAREKAPAGKAAPRCRQCGVCGAEMIRHRKDAIFCSPPCRAEASRVRAILRGSGTQPYASLKQRLDRLQRRTGPLIDATKVLGEWPV